MNQTDYQSIGTAKLKQEEEADPLNNKKWKVKNLEEGNVGIMKKVPNEA